MDAEAELRDLVAERVAAVAAKNPAPLAARQHPDILSYNVVPPLQVRGKHDVEALTQSWFDGYRSDIGYEVSDLNVTVSGDLGLVTFLYHVSGTLQDGGEVDMWCRATLGCLREDGRWLILHDHESTPFTP